MCWENPTQCTAMSTTFRSSLLKAHRGHLYIVLPLRADFTVSVYPFDPAFRAHAAAVLNPCVYRKRWISTCRLSTRIMLLSSIQGEWHQSAACGVGSPFSGISSYSNRNI